MNRLLLEPEEVGTDGRATLTGRRAAHVLGVLRAAPGDTLRVGLVDGPAGEATVEEAAGGCVTLCCRFEDRPAAGPALDLVLAVPRPKVLKRLWAPLAMLGVRRVMLVNAARVERAYFETHWLEPATIRERLLEGLEQAGATRLPRVEVRRRLRPFVEDELEAWAGAAHRLVAHPYGGERLAAAGPAPAGLVLAVGPEGGWVPFELELWSRAGFAPVRLAGGPLRSDVACLALLAVARETLAGG